MHMDENDIKSRLDELFFRIITCKQEHQRDLKRMWHSCKDVITEISKEEVICRRLNKETPKAKELKTELVSRLDNLEQYLMFAMLLNG